MADAQGRPRQVWQQVPEEVRNLIRNEAAVVGRELKGVRTPRQLRRRLADPALTERVAQPLSPVLDRICDLVGKTTVPISPPIGHALITASAALGATLSSGLEAFGVLGIELPPAAASAFAAAGTIGVATGLIEFYVTAATITTELRAVGRDDPALLRTALLANYLHLDGLPERPAGAAVGDSLGQRLALAVLRRVATRWMPIVGIPVSVTMANRDLTRARDHARRLGAGGQGEAP